MLSPDIAIQTARGSFTATDSVGEGALVRHIENVLENWRPFPIRLRGFRKSWDHWLFLTLAERNAEVIALYEEIYAGILVQNRRDDIEFIPHIGLGLFVKEGAQYDPKNPQQLDFDAHKYEQALREAKALHLDFRCLVDKLHLVKLADDFSSIAPGKVFPLGVR